jgi:hypothetical protein
MAKVVEEVYVVRLSKLVKGDSVDALSPKGFVDNVEAILGELVGDAGVIVEVEVLDSGDSE